MFVKLHSKPEVCSEFWATFGETCILPTLDDERSIIERAKKDAEAFGILFEQHYPAIFGYVLRRVED